MSISVPHSSTPQNDASLWAQAWTKVQQQQPILRARIALNSKGEPEQHATDISTDLDTVQLQANPDRSIDVIEQWIEHKKQQAFIDNAAMTEAAYVYVEKAEAVIYLNLHHLLADAWTAVLIWQDMQRHYNELHATLALSDTPRSELSNKPNEAGAETPKTFFDYLSCIRRPDDELSTLSESEIEDSHFHASPTTALPQKGREQSAVSFYQYVNNEPDTRSDRQTLPLSSTERQQIVSLQLGDEPMPVSPALHQMALHLAAFSIYLHRASGDKHIVIEVPLLGRFGKQWLGVAGNFIEMMQVNMTVNAQDTIARVYRHANEALATVLKQAGPGCTSALPTQSVHGVLNVITARVGAQGAVIDSEDHFMRWHHTGHSDMRHPLRLHIADWNASGIPALQLDMNHGFFKDVQRTRVPVHLASVYKAMLQSEGDASDAEVRVGTIALMGDSELWSLAGPAAPHVDNSHPAHLYERIKHIARIHPQAIALVQNGQQVSYERLIQLAHNVQQHLAHHGIGQNDRVAVLMHRALNVPIVLLGILASGAAYIPIDIAQPTTRVNAILTNSDAKALILDNHEFNSVDLEDSALITLYCSSILTPPDSVNIHMESDIAAAGPGNTAYIMYTSGSTGAPKGVVVSHGALMSYLDWAQDYYRLPVAISMPLFTSIGFDLTVSSLYLPWLSGGTLHVFPQSDNTEALALFDVLNNSAINTIKLTPAHLALLLESDQRIEFAHQFIVGGEDLKNNTAKSVQSRASHALKIVNEYGPTEATVGCIARVWGGSDFVGSVPIGAPIRGMTAYVLDSNGMPQFEGVTGELFLAGSSLAEGYWKAPDVTKTAFVKIPTVSDKLLYKTGDLVRIDNAELTYLGRKDTQVNINGYRVELSDIESVIMEHPAVSQCIVQFKDKPTVQQCSSCGLSSLYPEATINENGVCSLCESYSVNEKRIASYFRTTEDLQALVDDIKSRRRGKYDAVVLLSGGKDSTYALCQLVDLGLSVYAFSLDNGYISDQALTNIVAVCERLGVDHHYARTKHMDAIFNDSLTRYSNVCHGCFKTIYNLSLAFAAEHKIDTIFTGLSRGQLFETRLNNELFSDASIPVKNIDDMVIAARIQYHAIDDAPNTLLNIPAVNNGALPASVNIVDFYRYWHVEMADMLAYLKARVNWVRPPDTGRSTNCLINDVGIHVHKLERGFHNYALPYSWDVRLGHKEREEALEELDDDIDAERVSSILNKIQYTIKTNDSADISSKESQSSVKAQRGKLALTSTSGSNLEACFTTSLPIDESTLRHWLQGKLPAYMQPSRLLKVAQLPLNLHGKIDREKAFSQTDAAAYYNQSDKSPLIPLSASEQQVATLWAPYVAAPVQLRDDNFFQLGGDSQAAIRCVMQLRKAGYVVEPADLFKKPVLFKFAEFLQTAKQISSTPSAQSATKFSHLSDTQREKLSRLLKKQKTKN